MASQIGEGRDAANDSRAELIGSPQIRAFCELGFSYAALMDIKTCGACVPGNRGQS